MVDRRVDLFNFFKSLVCFLEFFFSTFSFVLFFFVQEFSFFQLNKIRLDTKEFI